MYARIENTLWLVFRRKLPEYLELWYLATFPINSKSFDMFMSRPNLGLGLTNIY